MSSAERQYSHILTSVRCFIASFLDPDCAAQLHAHLNAVRAAAQALRWLPAENYHITLQFLGNIDTVQLTQWHARIAALDGHRLRCHAAGWRGYPSSRKARAIALTLAPCPELRNWHQLLSGQESGEATGKNFEAHITVARHKRGVTLPELPNLQGTQLELLAPALYESETLPTGARYRRLD